MSVKLRYRKNADGSKSVRLDIWHDGKRWIETLKHLKLRKPASPKDREHNKELMQHAEYIRTMRALELESGNYNVITDAGKKTIITAWMQDYINKYTKKDKRNLQGALNRFIDFLTENKRQGLTFGGIDVLLIEDFIEYLEKNSVGEGAASYYARFKKMLKQAYRRKLIREDVLSRVERTPKGRARKKDILTLSEIQTLVQTPIESPEVKRAAIFSLMTGLRWVDVVALEWNHINIKEKVLNITQSKTGNNVAIPLNEAALKILGETKESGQVFQLPTANGANKTLKAWVKRAGITKKITWHNLRHSAGTNLVYNNVDVLTVSKILGHTSLKHTRRYVDAAEEMKRDATNKINIAL